MSDYEYKLFINNDIGNPSYNHWFYFSVINPRKTSITFNVVNMKKKDILYMAGMKPAIFSTKFQDTTGKKWHREGFNVSYTENKLITSEEKIYTLSFTYNFHFEKDKVFFAYSIPYTYSDLLLYLDEIKQMFPTISRVDTLCQTLAGNDCPMITITDSIHDYISSEQEHRLLHLSSNTRKLLRIRRIKNRDFHLIANSTYSSAQRCSNCARDSKKCKECKSGKEMTNSLEASKKGMSAKHCDKLGVVLMGRVHSGETVGSYMIKGAIDFLLSDTTGARTLRKKNVFKIVPMLNPDGVRYGNYRASLLGVDLNRKWKNPSKTLHPTIFFTKKMIEVMKELHDVKMVCDMHGHTKKFNVFMYGCCRSGREYENSKNNLLAKVIPYELGRNNKSFSFNDSHFRIEKNKGSTARVVFYQDFEIPHSYTLEASFFRAKYKKEHFVETDLERIGRDLAKLCLMFSQQRIYHTKIRETNEFLRYLMQNKLGKPVLCLDKNENKSKTQEKLNNDRRIEKQFSNIHSVDFQGPLEIDLLKSFIEVIDSVNTERSSESSKSNYEDQDSDMMLITEENFIDTELVQGDEETDFWNKIEIVKYSPDPASSGSDSEVFDLDYKQVAPTKKTRKSTSEKQEKLEEKPLRFVSSPPVSVQKSVRSKSIPKPNPTQKDNMKSLNMHIYNFGEKVQEPPDNSLIIRYPVFRSRTLIRRGQRSESNRNKPLPILSYSRPNTVSGLTTPATARKLINEISMLISNDSLSRK